MPGTHDGSGGLACARGPRRARVSTRPNAHTGRHQPLTGCTRESSDSRDTATVITIPPRRLAVDPEAMLLRNLEACQGGFILAHPQFREGGPRGAAPPVELFLPLFTRICMRPCNDAASGR